LLNFLVGLLFNLMKLLLAIKSSTLLTQYKVLPFEDSNSVTLVSLTEY
jgi:hypothetical protein